MEIQLPKWIIMEIKKDTDKSVQTVIKEILKEYINSEEGEEIRKRIVGIKLSK